MSRFRIFNFLLPVFLVVQFIHAGECQAAENVSTPVVKTFTVTPVDRPVAILAPNAQVAGPPEAVDPSLMKDFLAGIGGAEGGAHFVLTSKQPYIVEQGYLTLTLPHTVHPESAMQEFDDSNGKLEHLLIALSAGADGWTTVRMNRTGAGFNLNSVEVTRAN
jgi:hypothetical protein